MIDPDRFITDRLRAIDASGIRRVFDLAANLEKPVNLSIGQPHFDVPDPIKDAAVDAIRAGRNQYTVTQGIADLNAKVRAMIDRDYPDWRDGDYGTLIVSGVSGGLLLALMTCAGPGDEVIIADPYFVMYRHLITLAGAKAMYIDTYPDFQLTAERIAGHITERTKLVLFNSPANPTGVLADEATCRDVAQLCADRNVLLLSDEIYDTFCYDADPCPSPAAHGSDMLLMRGFSKSYGMTGWRLGWCAGPKPIIEQMAKLQQYTFVCAPSMVQTAGVVALDVDMSDYVEQYRGKRDRVVRTLGDAYELTRPGGTFYAFPKVPEHLGITASQFVERAIARNLLIVPGSVFSRRDTHFRISYACDDAMLDEGLEILLDLARA